MLTVRVLTTVFLTSVAVGACGKGENIQPTQEGVAPTIEKDATPLPDVVEETVVAKTCPPSLPGPELVLISTPSGSRYCIDRTEVTQGQYLEFLNAKGYPDAMDASGQSKECSENTSYVPRRTTSPDPCLDDPGYFLSPELTKPVACVDWCDAESFCRWAGKRLCGSIGGGEIAESALAAADESEWYNACSQSGATDYPYGNTYEPGRCVDRTYTDLKDPSNSWRPVEVADTPSACAGTTDPFSRLVNLSGNLAEWENSCKEHPVGGRLCSTRGGNIYDGEPGDLSCSTTSFSAYGTSYEGFGIRCCADAI